MQVLVVGATGSIGSALCQYLLREGNRVYGLARNPAKAAQLAVQEVIPVTGSIQQPDAYLELLRSGSIDVVIDASGAMADSAILLDHLVQSGKERLAKYQRVGVSSGPKLGFVYVSGMWVHGSDKSAVVSDNDAFVGTDAAKNPPVMMVAWRPELERKILAPATREVLDTAVVRSALTYGREHGIWTGYFMEILKAAKEGATGVHIPLDAEGVIALVHTDDAASGIGAMAQRVAALAGSGTYPVFDIVGSVEGLRAILEGAGRAFGLKGSVELVGVKEGDVVGDALGASTVGDAGKAKTLLGWAPKRLGMLQGIEVYANAWRAGFEKGSK